MDIRKRVAWAMMDGVPRTRQQLREELHTSSRHLVTELEALVGDGFLTCETMRRPGDRRRQPYYQLAFPSPMQRFLARPPTRAVA